MKPPAFAYATPETLVEALDLLAEHGARAMPLAGGQSLVAQLNAREVRPAVVIDLNGVPGLGDVSTAGRTLRIGALVRHSETLRSPAVALTCPLLQEAVSYVGHVPVRNRGTFGGSIAYADPSAELGAVVALLGGELELVSKEGRRTVPYEAFATGAHVTSREPRELVVGVELPLEFATAPWGFCELSFRAGTFAPAGATCALHVDDIGTVRAARVALFGVERAPRRLPATEASLVGLDLDQLADEGAERIVDDLEPRPGIALDPAYHRHLARVAVTRALTASARRAREVAA